MGIFGFSQTGAKIAVMATIYCRCHSVSFVMYISGVKFEDHCPNISRDILDSVCYCLSGTIYMYDIITFIICIVQKCEYL